MFEIQSEFEEKLEEAHLILVAIETVLWGSEQFPIISRIIRKMYEDELLYQIDLDDHPWVLQYLHHSQRADVTSRWEEVTA